jgi:hypothetical protein
MSIDNRWFLLLAIAAGTAAGVTVALTSRSQGKAMRKRQHKSDIKSWENEGGNLAPPPAVATQP